MLRVMSADMHHPMNSAMCCHRNNHHRIITPARKFSFIVLYLLSTLTRTFLHRFAPLHVTSLRCLLEALGCVDSDVLRVQILSIGYLESIARKAQRARGMLSVALSIFRGRTILLSQAFTLRNNSLSRRVRDFHDHNYILVVIFHFMSVTVGLPECLT